MANRRKPHDLKVLSGTFRPDRDGPKVQPQAGEFGDVAPPDHLGDAGQRAWSEAILALLKLRTLTSADRHALQLYAESWDRKAACDAELQGEGEFYNLPNGTKAIHPAAKRRDQAERMIALFHKNYGMTASARVSLSIQSVKGPSALERFKNGSGEFTQPIATRDRSATTKPPETA